MFNSPVRHWRDMLGADFYSSLEVPIFSFSVVRGIEGGEKGEEGRRHLLFYDGKGEIGRRGEERGGGSQHTTSKRP